jgi:hypothetical protein
VERSLISEHIRTLRKSHFRENQTQFAKRLSLAPVTVARYETNTLPPTDALRKLLDLSEDVGYADGMSAFSSALGPRWAMRTNDRASDQVFDVVMRVYGNWKAFLQERDKAGARAKLFASQIESGLQDLMSNTRNLTTREADDENDTHDYQAG